MSNSFVVVNGNMAADLLRSIATKMESGEVELTGFDNQVYNSLRQGTITVKWCEKGKNR